MFLDYIFMDYVSYLSCDVFDVVIFTCLICFCVCACDIWCLCFYVKHFKLHFTNKRCYINKDVYYVTFYYETIYPIYLSICLSVCLSVCLSIYLSIYLSICLSIYLSIYLSVCLSVTVPFFWHNTFVTVIYHLHFLFLHFCMANTLFILVQLNVGYLDIRLFILLFCTCFSIT